MIEVNNFDLIRSILKFYSNTEFYFLNIIQRKKDGNVISDSSDNNYRSIKNYYIRSIAEFDQRKNKIIQFCQDNNARAYIYLNKRETKQVSWAAAELFLQYIKEGRTNQCFKIFDHCCGIVRDQCYSPLWLIDIDNIEEKEKIKSLICQSKRDEDLRQNEELIQYEIPTVNGIHLITEKFNTHKFKQLCIMEDISIPEIKKDNPTLLYYKKNE